LPTEDEYNKQQSNWWFDYTLANFIVYNGCILGCNSQIYFFRILQLFECILQPTGGGGDQFNDRKHEGNAKGGTYQDVDNDSAKEQGTTYNVPSCHSTESEVASPGGEQIISPFVVGGLSQRLVSTTPDQVLPLRSIVVLISQIDRSFIW
jgi:hypothetical protein